MSEINSILTSSNKFLYNQSELPPFADGINYFNNTYHLVKSYNFKETLTYTEISFRFTPSETVRNQITFCHVHGTITKDISSSISFYSINNRTTKGNQVPNTIALSANPYSNIDYIDYIWIPCPIYDYVYIYSLKHTLLIII